MDYTEERLRREEIYRGKIIYVHRDLVRLTDGSEAFREIVEHDGGVAVIPVDRDGTVFCVRQYRYAFADHLLEVPAGKLEPGENPLECAVRELGEETGLTAGKYTYLGALYPSPGYCNEVLHLYLASDLQQGRAHLDSGEFLDVERHSLSELVEMVMNNTLADAKTAMAVLKAQYELQKGSGSACPEPC